MKKYGLILQLSFMSYLFVALASPYVTAQTWADLIFMLFLGCCGYQLLYLFYLRKKENVSFLRSVANLILYFTFTVYLYIIIYYIYTFFNGYTTGFFGYGDTYYGIDAWIQDDWGRYIFIPLFIICFVYQISYFAISRRIKNGRK